MRPVHVMTISPALPERVLDEILTSTEATLRAHGAERVWIDAAQAPLAVLAAFPPPPSQDDDVKRSNNVGSRSPSHTS